MGMKDIYENGKAEATLLRAARAPVTILAVLVLAYAALDSPLPHGVSTSQEFNTIFHQLTLLLSVGAIGGLLAAWFGGHGAPRVSVPPRWAASQAVKAVMVMAVAILLAVAWLSTPG